MSTFSSGRRHTMGVGVNAGGKVTASGTTTTTNSIAHNAPTLNHGETVLWLTGFHWIKEQMYGVCGQPPGGRHRVRATAVQDGLRAKPVAAPNLGFCFHHPPRGSTGISQSQGHTFAGGAETGAIIGANLSAETDYTSSTTTTFFSNYPGGYDTCWEGQDSNGELHGIVEGLASYPGGGGCAAKSPSSRKSPSIRPC